MFAWIRRWLRKKELEMPTNDRHLEIKQLSGDKRPYGIIIGKELIDQQTQEIMSSEAKYLLRTQVYKSVLASLNETAGKKILNKAKTFDDIWYNRGALWALEVLDTKLRNISKLNDL